MSINPTGENRNIGKLNKNVKDEKERETNGSMDKDETMRREVRAMIEKMKGRELEMVYAVTREMFYRGAEQRNKR